MAQSFRHINMAKGNLYTVREIGKEWNNEMLEILKQSPIESKGLTICFDKSPDIFMIPELKSQYYKCAGFFKNDELTGFGMLLFYQAYVNGEPKTIAHFCNVYVKKESRNRGFYFRASDFFFKNLYKDTNLGYTIIMKGNKAAESHINRRNPKFKNLPYSKVISYLIVKNVLITFRKKESKEYLVRQAGISDIDKIVSLLRKEFSNRLFAPLINRETFLINLEKRPDFDILNYYIAEDRDKIVGVCAAWDTNSFKQNRIIRYSKKLKLIRNLYSLFGTIFGFPSLPREGEAFKDIVIPEYAVMDRNPKIMNALLIKIYNDCRNKNYNMIIFGSCYNDPLLKAVKRFFYQNIVSNIILGSTDKSLIEENKIDISLPYIDVSLL